MLQILHNEKCLGFYLQGIELKKLKSSSQGFRMKNGATSAAKVSAIDNRGGLRACGMVVM